MDLHIFFCYIRAFGALMVDGAFCFIHIFTIFLFSKIKFNKIQSENHFHCIGKHHILLFLLFTYIFSAICFLNSTPQRASVFFTPNFLYTLNYRFREEEKFDFNHFKHTQTKETI